MPVYKSENGTFYVQYFYRDGRGAKRHKVKRGFETELDALLWEKDFRASHLGTMDMTFRDFMDVYAAEIKPHIREHSWIDKEYIINDEITPFFGDMRMNEIKPVDVVRWQNELIQYRNKDGEPYSPTYLRTINNQLAAIFNHAERYYDLPNNPVSKTTRMGSLKGSEMVFWTKEEYLSSLRQSWTSRWLSMHLRFFTGQVFARENFLLSPRLTSTWTPQSSASRSHTNASGVWTPSPT